MTDPLIATPGDTFVGVLALVIVAAWCIAYCIAQAAGNVQAAEERWDEQTAADHGEPTRAQVEADMAADDEWADILAAVSLTPEQVRRGYQAARMDRIRADIRANREVAAFRDELDAFGGGAV